MTEMNVNLVAITPAAEMVCAQAAAICTGAEPSLKVLNHAVKSGHTSVLEHAVATFRIDGVSRVLLAQLTRHRLASFSVESQRYCGVKTFDIIRPASFEDFHYRGAVDYTLYETDELYSSMVADGIPEEDARFVVAQGTPCSLFLTMNARELLHFFSLRCCVRAQWEIRQLANAMLEIMKTAMPNVFKNGGAYCDQNGYCREVKCCGRAPKIKDLLALYEREKTK